MCVLRSVGYGKNVWSGSTFKGQYVNDKREGYGIIEFANKSWYEGKVSILIYCIYK
jgi:hypothetical protein